MKKGTIPIVIGLLLLLAAGGLTVYNLITDNQAGDKARLVLAELENGKEGETQTASADIEENPLLPEKLLDPDREMPEKEIDGRKYVGTIILRTIDIELPVCSEWNYDNLTVSPCRYAGTCYTGNFVICAHNYQNHFGQISNLSLGDEVIFKDMDDNVFKYRVFGIEILQPTQVEDMTISDADLTLFTCTLGGLTRVTVRCEKI